MRAYHLLLTSTHQIPFGGDGHQNQVVTDAHLLTLRPLFAGRMHRPPARLALAVLLQTHVEGELVVGRRRGQAGQILSIYDAM